jgi:hypothetical protein
MTLPTPDAQSSRFQANFAQTPPPSHSIPVAYPTSSTQSPFVSPASSSESSSSFTIGHYEHAFDFATHSLDLATGGMKTLTAKRELPTRPDRRTPDISAELATSHSYMFALVIMVCVVLMLIGGGIVLVVMSLP